MYQYCKLSRVIKIHYSLKQKQNNNNNNYGR